MKKIINSELIVAGGSTPFCEGVAAVDIIAGGLIALNLWNPVGWGLWATATAVNAYCAFA